MFKMEQIKNLHMNLMHTQTMTTTIQLREDGYHVVCEANYGTTHKVYKTPEEAVHAANMVEIAYVSELTTGN
jgi:hypothetical protein